MKEIWYMNSPYLMLLSALLFIFIAAYLFFTQYLKKHSLSMLLNIILLAGNISWIAAFALKLIFPGTGLSLICDYIVISLGLAIPALWFFYTAQYSSRNKEYRYAKGILTVLLICCFGLIATNHLHHLLWEFRGLELQPKTGYLSLSLLSLALLCLGGITLFQNLLLPYFIFRWQAFTLILAILIPTITILLEQLTGTFLLHPLILAPYSYIVSTWLIRLTRTHFSAKDIITISRASFFENINDAILVMDKDSRILDLNPTAKLILEEYTEDILNKSLAGVHPVLFDFLARFNITNDLPPFIKLEISAKAHFYDIEISPFIDWDGQMISQIMVLHDITERKTAEEALRKSEAKLRNLIQQSIDGILIIDPQGHLSEWNEGLEKITGISKESVLNQPAWTVFSKFLMQEGERAADPLQLQNAILEALGSGNATWYSELMETNIPHPQGILRTLQQQTFPISTDSGFALGSIIRDITNNILLEAERIKSGKLEALGILAGGIAHDFNNVLTAIIGNISLAKIFGQNDKLLTLLTEAEEASARAKDLTYQLLIFARGGAPICEPSSILEIIKTAADFSLHGTNVDYELSVIQDIWPVEVDLGQMNQVLCNLIINAVEAMPAGGKIQIPVTNIHLRQGEIPNLEQGRYVKFSIIDEGCGISSKILTKIYDPYFSTKTHGNGLGLAIAWAIIKGHHGFINVNSIEHIGTNFTLYLKASEHKIEVKEKKKELQSDYRARILVMDDDAGIRATLKRLLQEMNHTASFTEEGHQAVTRYRQALNSQEPYELVILDLTVKNGMGGKDTMEKLLEIDTDVKAIVSSGYSNDTVVANYKKYGFKAFLHKPYNMEELQKTINSVLGDY